MSRAQEHSEIYWIWGASNFLVVSGVWMAALMGKWVVLLVVAYFVIALGVAVGGIALRRAVEYGRRYR